MGNRILIRGGIVLTMEEGSVPEKKDILIDGDRIALIGSIGQEQGDFSEINASECVVMPGLINTHTHTPMTIMRSTADNLGSPGKHRSPIFPPGQDWTGNLTPEDVYWSSSLAITEMIRTGTTTFVDMFHDMDQVAQAVIDTGIRGALGWEILTFRNDPVLWLPYDESNARKSFEACAKFATDWRGKGDGRVMTLIAPHEAATCQEPWLSRAAELAGQLNLPITIHVSEGEWELDFCKEFYGLTPVEVLQKAGILDHRVIGAHSIYLNPHSIQILKGADYTAATCLGAYLRLAGKTTPIADLLAAGVNVATGTDSAQTNNNLNLWDEIYLVAALPGFMAGDASLVRKEKALRMATIDGAKAIGMDKELGTLEVGKKADIIILDGRKPTLRPLEGALIGNLVYAANGYEVRDVLVDGKILMRDWNMIGFDEAEVLKQSEAAVHRLREEVGLPHGYTQL